MVIIAFGFTFIQTSATLKRNRPDNIDLNELRKTNEAGDVSERSGKYTDFQKMILLFIAGVASSPQKVNPLVLLLFYALYTGMILLFAFFVKTALYLWDPTVSNMLPNIWKFGILLSLAFVVFTLLYFAAGWARSKDMTDRLYGIFTISVLAVCLYIASVSIYSGRIYTLLDQGLGGGKPYEIALLISRDFLSDTETDRNLNCAPSNENLALCREIYLYYIDNKNLVVADDKILPNSIWLIPRDKIFAFYWSEDGINKIDSK